jgi:hypothetical protein
MNTSLEEFKEQFRILAGVSKPHVAVNNGNVTFTKICEVTKKPYILTVTVLQYTRWKQERESIQNVFPELSSEQREFLTSGTTPKEWDKLWEHQQ